jgi:ribonuclease HI
MQVEVYSDGSATIATKPGGYGYVVVIDGALEKTGSGAMPLATNNDAELEGAIQGLKAAKEIIYNNPRHFNAESSVTLVSDSQIVLGWVSGDLQFRQATKQDKYIELVQLVNQLRVKTRWVEGHSGDPWNEKCDELANEARKSLLPPEAVKPKKEKKKKQLSPPEGQLSPSTENNCNPQVNFSWNQKPAPAPQTEVWDPTLHKFLPQQQDMRTDKEKLFAMTGVYIDTAVLIRVLQELVTREENRK